MLESYKKNCNERLRSIIMLLHTIIKPILNLIIVYTYIYMTYNPISCTIQPTYCFKIKKRSDFLIILIKSFKILNCKKKKKKKWYL